MESRFDTKNDCFEVIGDSEASKSLSLSIEFFRWEANKRRSQATNKPDNI